MKADAAATPAGRPLRGGWPAHHAVDEVDAGAHPDAPPGRIETMALRPGFLLMLNALSPVREWTVDHAETDDVVGIGFHLRGGAAFAMTGADIRTQALDCWAAAAPRGARTRVRIPAAGFRTVSLRFSCEQALALFDDAAAVGNAFGALARDCGQRVSSIRGRSLRASEAATVAGMLDDAYCGAARRLHLESCALSLLAAQLRSDDEGATASPNPRELRRLRQLRDYLDAHLDDPPGIAALARLAGINEFKLKRDFKRAFGQTVFGYVREQRLAQAAVRLRAGDSVTQAALQVGYSCPSRFAQAFRQQFGYAPSRLPRT